MALWNHKKGRADTVNSRYTEAAAHIEQLLAGCENRLAVLYPMLWLKDKALVNIVAEAIHRYMRRLQAADIIRLDRQFRQYTSMEWSIDWQRLSPEDIQGNIYHTDVCQSALRLGTLHPNGYFREKCMKALENDESSYAYIALRLNDWVKQVRETAYGILARKLDGIGTDTAIGMLPIVSRTKNGQRYQYRQFQEIEEKLAEKILRHLDEVSLDKVRDYPPATKRFLYHILITPKVLSKQDAEWLLEREKNGNEKALMIRLILECYECGEEQIESYLKNKSPIVRKKALEVKYGRIGNAWEGLEEHLLDTARGIRSDVCYILRKHTAFDILSFYKEKLHTRDEAVAILGVGENGSAKDAECLAKYLYSDRVRLIKNAIRAISGLEVVKIGAINLADVYWDYLFGMDALIAKDAFHAVCRNDIRYGAGKLYQAYTSCLDDRIRKYLLRLLVREPSWERLPYLLLLYEPGCTIADKPQMLIHRTLGTRSVYARITKAQADFILRVLKEREAIIPDGMKKEIIFDLEHITVVG